MKPFIDQATEIHKDIIDMRRKLHSNPELSFKEYQTTQYIKQILDRLDIEIVDWGGETRVVGLLKGKAPGPVVALRALAMVLLSISAIAGSVSAIATPVVPLE